MHTILVPQDILSLNAPEVTCTYISVAALSSGAMDDVLITSDNIAFMCYGKKYTAAQVKKINVAMNFLCERTSIEKYSTGKYIVNWERDFKINKGTYAVALSLEHFSTIFKSESHRKCELAHHLCNMIMSFNYNLTFIDENHHEVRSVVGTMPLSFFANKYSVSTSTVGAYNKALEDLDILYVIRMRYIPNENYPLTNVYSLYENKRFAEKYASSCDSEKRRKTTSRSNYLRSIAQRYNRFIFHPEGRTREGAEKLLDDVLKFNQDYPDRSKNTTAIEAYLSDPSQETAVPELTPLQKQKVALGLASIQDFIS